VIKKKHTSQPYSAENAEKDTRKRKDKERSLEISRPSGPQLRKGKYEI
jgi:hypothetical protein